MSGTLAIKDKAISWFHSVEYSPINVPIPMVNGRASIVFVKTTANKNSFQARINVYTPVAIKPGWLGGIIILKKILNARSHPFLPPHPTPEEWSK